MTEIPHTVLDRIKQARDQDATTDLHITRGGRVCFWVSGAMTLTTETIAETDLQAFYDFVIDDSGRAEMRKYGRARRVISSPLFGRIRVTFFRSQGEMNIDIRLLQKTVPSFDSINAPLAIRQLVDYKTGIISFAGPPDAGKTTTIAAFVNELNTNPAYATHIFTVERPTEYEHESKESLITAIDVGPERDTPTIAAGLQTALTANARVIVAGEMMMDYETARAVVDAAEAGFLVLVNHHTPDTLLATERMIAPFPPEEKTRARAVLSHTNVATVGLRLIQDKQNKPRLLTEILYGTEKVKKAIADQDLPTLKSALSQKPNFTFEQSLDQMIRDGHILPSDAPRILNNVDPRRAMEYAGVA